MQDKRFMTLEEYQDEYWDEYINGENIDILEFLKRKKQEALETGDKELAEHIETIYNEAYEEEEFDENVYEEEQITMQDDDELADDYDESEWYEAYLNRWIEGYKRELEEDGADKYEEYLKEIEKYKKYIKDHQEELEDESLDEDERYDHEDSIREYERKIEEYTSEIKDIEFKRDIVQFVTSLKSMNPEEIEEEYVSLLEERDSYTFMAEDGIKVSRDKSSINRDKIGLIEAYVVEFPETQKLIQAQKEKYERMAEQRKQTEKELIESMEYEESLRNVPIDETSHRAKTPEELESMSEEELQQLIANNDQTIEENNTAIKKKKALIEKVLAQQEIIAEQQTEMNRLNRQKKEL